MAIGKVVLALEMQTAAFTSGADTGGKSLKKLGYEAHGAREEVKGLRGALEELKNSAGRGSTLDELGKTLRGAGAVAGLSLMGEAANKVTSDLARLNKEFADGKIGAAGVAAELGKSLPIIGGFVSAGQNIREMFTHEQEQIDEINASIKSGNAVMEDRVRIQRENKAINDEIAEGIRKANEQLALANAVTPEDKKRVEEANRIADNAHDDKRTFAEKEKAQKESLDKEIEDIRKNQAEKKKLAEQQALEDLTSYQRHANRDDAVNARNDAKWAVDLRADNETKILIDAAKAREAQEIAILKSGLDKQAALRDEAAKKEATKSEVQSIAKSAGSEIRKFITDVAKLGEEINKTAAETKHRAAEEQKHQIEEVKKQIADLQKEARQVGMDASQKRLDDLKHAPGATPEDIKQAQALQNSIDLMEHWKTEQEEAKRLIAESLTPMQKYQEEVTKLQQMFKDHLLSAPQLQTMISKAKADLVKEDKKEDGPANDGKAALLTRRFDFNLPNQNTTQISQQQLQAAKDQLAQAQKANGYLADLWRFGNNTDSNPDVIADY